MFFITKLNFTHQEFLPRFLKSFISEMPFTEHILLENVSSLHTEKLKTTFHFLKENQRFRPFAIAMSGNTFFH